MARTIGVGTKFAVPKTPSEVLQFTSLMANLGHIAMTAQDLWLNHRGDADICEGANSKTEIIGRLVLTALNEYQDLSKGEPKEVAIQTEDFLLRCKPYIEEMDKKFAAMEDADDKPYGFAKQPKDAMYF